MENSSNEVLIINDFTGYGRVSTHAMIPVFSAYGMHTYSLPTALLSNTMDYPVHELIDTTDFMKKTIRIWNKLGFKFKNICIGLINSDEQVEIISDLIKMQNSPFILIDPIMADNGALYDGMYSNVVECNRRLAGYADIFLPNLTEAQMLAGMYPIRNSLAMSEYQLLLEGLSALGAKDIVITGCTSTDGSTFNLICGRDGKIEALPFESIDLQFAGTGDIFSAVLMSETMNGNNLRTGVSKASDFILRILRSNLNNEDHFDLRYESLLKLLNK